MLIWHHFSAQRIFFPPKQRQDYPTLTEVPREGSAFAVPVLMATGLQTEVLIVTEGLLWVAATGSWLVFPWESSTAGQRGRWERVGEVHPLGAFDGALVKWQKTQSAAAEGLQQDPGSSCTVTELMQVNGKASKKPRPNSTKKLSCRREKQKWSLPSPLEGKTGERSVHLWLQPPSRPSHHPPLCFRAL